jgi:DNA-binding NarL/FixJ family response regulator
MSANGHKLNVLVVDDSEVMRTKLRSLFATGEDAEGINLVGEAADGEEGVRLSQEHQPDVVVMDLKMPGMSGIEATWKLGSVSPTSEVLMLTISEEQQDVADAIMAGAKGYVVKGASDDEVLAAVRKVAAGERTIDPAVADELVKRDRPHPTEPLAAPAPPRQAISGMPASSAAETFFDPRTLAQTLGIAVVVGVLLTMASRGEEFMNGNATPEDWILGVINISVCFLVFAVGLLAGRATAR